MISVISWLPHHVRIIWLERWLSATHTTEVWPMTPTVSAPIRRSLSTSWAGSAHIRGPERPLGASVVSRTAVPNTTYSTLFASPTNPFVVISIPMTASAPANCAS